jgi:uncharacterized membrane protein YozB (DUF420 family)
MAIPLYSTITLFTEIIMTAVILYIFYSGYKNKKFPTKLAFIAIAYEVLLNISYMVYRTLTESDGSKIDSGFEIVLAIMHGVLALVLFIALIVFLILAWKNYKKGVNYFKKHKYLTMIFIIFWLMAVLSGILFYFVEYVF